ncbi:MAG: DUF2442 domain-containing protein [Fibrobacter sp.]|uniref:DUF2442 domain-containing protein n=1 Tax=Fibrobacter sp. TaxID=35828 RepID=UPI001B038A9D|nr:DUF2442 domain-containing protein [Fibrobacter sp.]MBO7061549.1 DUF2442 domain-containing protein [Fibrobacter sp.]MBO7105981.1 DUF2442 domain-containing protein [Fibrobacter sp.]
MFIMDGICYAGSFQENIKVTEAKPLVGRMLLLTFSTGEKRLFDTNSLKGSAFSVLDDDKIFRNPSIFHGVVTWDNGNVDVAPETLYHDSIAYESEDAM